MNLIFLQSAKALTKTFTRLPKGTIEKASYPHVLTMSSTTEPCTDLSTFEHLLKHHAALGHCLLKGVLNKEAELHHESRAGSTNSNDATSWVCLDIDNLPGCKDVESFLNAVGLGDVSYIVQHSASSLIENKNVNAHVFMLLDEEQPAPLLKQWLIDLNHKTPMLSNAMHLTKTDNSLHWPLDISVCQNDKLIYIAPPILKKIKDPYLNGARIKLVKKAKDKLTITNAITNVSVNAERTDKRVNELREAKGLPARKFVLKFEDGIQVLQKPDRATTYDTRSERGFVYFNLNGGSNWSYYHPENNPKYIHNFKSEPVYLTRDLIPEYWAEIIKQEKIDKQLAAQAPIALVPEGDTYLAFSDRKTSTYWKGTYNQQTNTLDLTVAKTAKHISDFIKAHGLPYEDFIPEWDVIFDPLSDIRVDAENRTINTFEPTQYMKNEHKKSKLPCPSLIYRIVNHALGCDPATTSHFMNWLAFIVQFRDRTNTAWVLHGTTGTGKGLLMNKILRPLFGFDQTAIKLMEEVGGLYNAYMEKCFIVYVDECESGTLQNEKSVMGKLKTFITEAMVPNRAMFRNSVLTRNYTNWIFASNKPGVLRIDREDRRMNVGKYQPHELVITEQEVDNIENELQQFHDYLAAIKVDKHAVRTPIESESREDMIDLTWSSIDSVASALVEGNFGFFMAQRPTSEFESTDPLKSNKAKDYDNILATILKRTRENGMCNLHRDEMYTIFDFTIGNMPTAPHKFTKLLGHHRLKIIKVSIETRTVNGIQTTWKDLANFDDYARILSPQKNAPTANLRLIEPPKPRKNKSS